MSVAGIKRTIDHRKYSETMKRSFGKRRGGKHARPPREALKIEMSPTHQQNQTPRNDGKRRSTGTEWRKPGVPAFKRRKSEYDATRMVLPKKFLLGGDISDPLNLKSLNDAEVNKKENLRTPDSSPLPVPSYKNETVQILIPPNVTDPLQLNDSEQVLSPKHSGKKKKKKKKIIDNKFKLLPDDTNDDTTEPPHKVLKTELTVDVSSADAVSTDMTVTPQLLCADKKPAIEQISPKRRRQRKSSSRQVSGDHKSPRLSRKFMTKKQVGSKMPKFREKDAKFRHGNYNRYYGYRVPDQDEPRLKSFRKEWFEGKDVLDLGCNVGFITLTLAKVFHPRKVIGLDIDATLIKAARKNVRHYLSPQDSQDNKFPLSSLIIHGPIAAPPVASQDNIGKFPNNIQFVQGNYVLASDDLLELEKEEFDTVLCLSLTKWVHLNFGDDGLKRLFRRMFRQLKPGGRMVLEAQALPSYRKAKKLTETMYSNFKNMQLKPEHFVDYLLSPEVGFSTCRVIDMPFHKSRGFRRPLQLFTKGGGPSVGSTPQYSSRSTPSATSSNVSEDATKKASDEDDIKRSCTDNEDFDSDSNQTSHTLDKS